MHNPLNGTKIIGSTIVKYQVAIHLYLHAIAANQILWLFQPPSILQMTQDVLRVNARIWDGPTIENLPASHTI